MNKKNGEDPNLASPHSSVDPVIEAIAAGVFIFQEAQILYVNRAAEIITGYARDKLLSMGIWQVIQPDFSGLVQKYLEAGLTGEPATKPLEIKLTGQQKEVWVEFSVAPVEFVGQKAMLATVVDITQQKQMKGRLQTIQTRYRTLFDRVPVGLYRSTPDGRAVDVNQAMAEILGYANRESLLNVNIVDFYADIECRRQWQARMEQEETVYDFDAQVRKKDGTIIWIRDNARVVRNANGQVQYYEGAVVDITERQQTRKQIVDLNRKLIALQYAGATVASSLDIDLVLDTFTQELVNLLEADGCILYEWLQPGYTLQVSVTYSSTGLRLGDVLTTTTFPLADFPLKRRVLAGPESHQLGSGQSDIPAAEVVHMQTLGVQSLLMLPMEYQGEVVGLVEVVSGQARVFTLEEISLGQFLANMAANVITNARLYRQINQELDERRRLLKELEHKEAQSRAFIKAIPDLIFQITGAGRIVSYHLGVNIDLKSEDFVGKYAPELGPAELVEQGMVQVNKALRLGTIESMEFQLNQRHYEARIVAIDADEALVIVRDITEKKRVEQQLIKTERLTALGRLTACLAHEMNNPIQAVQSYLELMLGHSLNKQQQLAYLRIVHGQIERLSNLTRHVLNFTQSRTLPRKRVEVPHLMAQVLELVKTQAEQSNIEIKTAWQTVPPVQAVADQLLQVFLNLLMNAIEAIGQDGFIDITIYSIDNTVVVAISNSGPSIPQEILVTIFEPFFTTKAEGSGLGLWVSHNLIQRHGGTLTVKNMANNQGVKFVISLPLDVP